MRRVVMLVAMGLLWAGGLAAEDKPAPTMPSEVTLTSGRVLRKVQVIRWENERVVLKHAAGVDPIAFTLIKSIPRTDLDAMKAADDERKKQVAETQRKIATLDAEIAESKRRLAESERRLDERREEASRHGTLMEGQTEDQVRRVLGGWARRNEYDSGRSEQVIYELDRGDTYYVYFEEGRVTSWQKFDRRRR